VEADLWLLTPIFFLDNLLLFRMRIYYTNYLIKMKLFYLTSLPNPEGRFIVYDKDCLDIPSIYDRDYLGPFNLAVEALRFVTLKRGNINICLKCGCHNEIYALIP